ncbi:hypothetical protein BDZ45DRAFT_672880 [Acephala macrosclerotiorum]|nr:hypothetical protein BDZ45DRAFT_672880 [Acephala macrosclerotiorum]
MALRAMQLRIRYLLQTCLIFPGGPAEHELRVGIRDLPMCGVGYWAREHRSMHQSRSWICAWIQPIWPQTLGLGWRIYCGLADARDMV